MRRNCNSLETNTSHVGSHCFRTFSGKKLLLRSFHLINAIEREGKLLGFVLRVRNADDIKWITLMAGFASHNNIFVEFFAQERPNSRDNLRDCKLELSWARRDVDCIPLTDMIDELNEEKAN